jgi:hypothetical protein
MASLLSLSDELLLMIISEAAPFDGLVPLAQTCRKLYGICHERVWIHRAFIRQYTIVCLDLYCDHSQHHARFDCHNAVGTEGHNGARKKRRRWPACSAPGHNDFSSKASHPAQLVWWITQVPEMAQYIKCILLPMQSVRSELRAVRRHMRKARRGRRGDQVDELLWQSCGFRDLYLQKLNIIVSGEPADRDNDQRVTEWLYSSIEERICRRTSPNAPYLTALPYSAAADSFHLTYLLTSLCPNLECLRFHDSEEVEAFLRVCESLDNDIVNTAPEFSDTRFGGRPQEKRQPLRALGIDNVSFQTGRFERLRFLYPALVISPEQQVASLEGRETSSAAEKKLIATSMYRHHRQSRYIESSIPNTVELSRRPWERPREEFEVNNQEPTWVDIWRQEQEAQRVRERPQHLQEQLQRRRQQPRPKTFKVICEEISVPSHREDPIAACEPYARAFAALMLD